MEWNGCCNCLFIVIDEAQIIYQLGHEHFFWRSVKERLQKTNGLFFVLFSAYGERPVNTSQGNVFATPIAIPCVCDLSFLLLGKEEYDELIQGYNKTDSGLQLPIGTGDDGELKCFRFSYITCSCFFVCYFKYSDASNALWLATRGHPGLVRLCIDAIRSALLPQVKRGDRADDGTIVAFLLSCELAQCIYNTRILPEHYNFEQEVMCSVELNCLKNIDQKTTKQI